MKLETILALAAVSGVGYLLWDKFGGGITLPGASIWSTVPQANRPFPAGGVIPAGTPITPNCQLPCPDGMACTQALNGVRDAAGVCGPIMLRMN